MKLDVSSNVADVMRRMDRMRRDQIPFALSRAMNDVGQKIQSATPGILERDLDRPTRFTTDPRGMFLERATKTKVEAAVGFRPLQSAYLKYQVEGGIRAPKRKALRLPTAQPLDAFGNLPARTIRTLVARAQQGRRLTKKQAGRLRVSQKVDIFYGDPSDGRPPGLYQRVPLSGPGDNRLIPLIVFPEQSARYEKRVRWYEDAERIARREIGPAFARRMREAMATAR